MADEDLVATGRPDQLVMSRDKDGEEIVKSDQGDITGHGQADRAGSFGLVGQLVFGGPGIGASSLSQVLGGDPADGKVDEFGDEPAIGCVGPFLGIYPGRIR